MELSKDNAMKAIARGGNSHTRYYWSLAVETNDCPNWIARWFLYHRFRYRDGRNRNYTGGSDARQADYRYSSRHSHNTSAADDKSSASHSETSFHSDSMVHGTTKFHIAFCT